MYSTNPLTDDRFSLSLQVSAWGTFGELTFFFSFFPLKPPKKKKSSQMDLVGHNPCVSICGKRIHYVILVRYAGTILMGQDCFVSRARRIRFTVRGI